MSPSPIAHSAMGFLIFWIFRKGVPPGFKKQAKSWLLLLGMAVFFSMLPDIDVVPGILLGDFVGYHNQGTHSLLIGLGVAIAVGLILMRRYRRFWLWFWIALAGYTFHVIMDYFTTGERGVMLFWPLSSDRFVSPFKIFYGVRWSEGLLHPAHLLTVGSELAFVGVIILIAYLMERKTGITKIKREKRAVEVNRYTEGD